MAEPGKSNPLATLRQKAVAAHRAGELDAAQKHYVSYLSRSPGDAGLWSNLGALFRTMGEPEQAIRAHMRAYAISPNAPGVRGNYANALSDIGRYQEALVLRHEILRAQPDDVQQKALIGRALRGMGDYDASIDFLQASHVTHPDDAEIELQLAFSMLGAGEYEAGFRHYQSRWRTGEMKSVKVPYPRWAGEDLKGKTVLVMPEQGFGDAVLMMRFLPELKERGATVVCLTEKPMTRLFAQVPGADVVAHQIKPSDDIDYFIPLMDLPLLGLKNPGDIPPPTRLSVPEDSSERAREIVQPYKSEFRIGVVWTGSTTYKGNAFRSFTHREFLPLAEIPEVQLFSLYKGPMLEQFHADGSGAFLIDAGSSDRDFADCAAMMQAMDLIITSDTATAHIGGSLGIPTWVVLHWDPFWVYRHDGMTTPWYPSMRLFRQQSPLCWEDVFDEVRAALEEEIEG